MNRRLEPALTGGERSVLVSAPVPAQPDQGDELYERHAKPHEAAHWGAFIAVSPNGETLLGRDLLELAQQAASSLGKGFYLFRVGERSVGHIR